MDIKHKNELKLIRKNAILDTLSQPLVICIIIAPIVFGLIDGSRKITETANRYKEAGYLVTINDNSMIVEKQ